MNTQGGRELIISCLPLGFKIHKERKLHEGGYDMFFATYLPLKMLHVKLKIYDTPALAYQGLLALKQRSDVGNCEVQVGPIGDWELTCKNKSPNLNIHLCVENTVIEISNMERIKQPVGQIALLMASKIRSLGFDNLSMETSEFPN